MKTTAYVVLLRGINVGLKNRLSMADLKACLIDMGYQNVASYINSGNIILTSSKSASTITSEIEAQLPRTFKLDDDLMKVLVLSRDELAHVIASKPRDFGDEPGKYHSDVIFLIDTLVDEVLHLFNPRVGVDAIWPGNGVIFSRRLSAERMKSRLSRIMTSPFYKSMTIRTWGTVTKLFKLVDELGV